MGEVVFSDMRIRRVATFLLAITVCVVFGSAGTAQAGSGVYPGSPQQITPLNYSGGITTIEFEFASYNSYYTNENGTFFGFPIAYHIEMYHGPNLLVSDDVWNTTISYDGFIIDETYSWQVYAIYEFYDEYAEYAGMDYSDLSSASFRNIPATTPASPEPIFPILDLQTEKDAFVGGKRGSYWWYSSPGAQSYTLNVAKDANFSDNIAIFTATGLLVGPPAPIADLPADGSRIFWRVGAYNEFGWNGYSQPVSFINDCNMPSFGTGGVLTHIDTCSDDVTRVGGNYFLKDMSRRIDNTSHAHNGRMKKDASIITGLESENLVNGEQKQLGVQISPFQDTNNKWGDLPFQSDAINAQVNTAGFYDYLLQSFMKPTFWGSTPLNSYDGNGSSMYNLIDDAPSCSFNYWYSGTRNAHFCPNNSRYPELVGHEWGHAVTGTASDRGNFSLGEYEEAGAMDEAFSDWLGMAYKQAICNSGFSSAANVKPLADCTNLWLFQGWQDFANLNPANYPNYYKGQWYKQPSYPCGLGNDNCGIHTNSFVPNIMFYLLSAGGEHPYSKIKVGSLENGVRKGIGIESAIQIASRSNIEYWPFKTNSTFSFADAADRMFDAVNELFSNDPRDYPNNLHQLKNAWAAVGVCTPVPLNPEGTKISCGLPVIKLETDSSKGTVSDPVKTVTINNKQQQYEPVWGGTVTVVATPLTGYEFESWKENGTVVPNAPQSYTFQVKRDQTLTANFKPVTAKDFGVVNVDLRSLPQTITISNYVQPEQAVIYLGQAQRTGLHPNDFLIENDTCSGRPLNRNASCTLHLVFKPQTTGLREATFSISATANNQTVLTTSYPLVGNGFAANIYVTPSSTNGGTVTLSGSQLWGGTATATATPNPGYAFNGWQEDGVTVSLTPSYSFTVTASRSLLAMFSSTTAVIAAAPLSGNFGVTTTGTTSPEHTFVITNNGFQSLSISAISISGINRADFGVTYNDCVQPLSPNASCSIRMIFTPASPSTKTARLNITSNDPANQTYVIALSGYGGTPVLLYTGGYYSDYYSSAQSAYNSTYDGTEIRLWAADFNESLNCNRPVTTTISGGYNGNFTDKIGKSALHGVLTISSGTVVVDGLQLGGSSYSSALSVVIDTGSGTITSAPAGINCPGNCTASFVTGDMITLTAATVGDSLFTGWSGGGCSGIGNCRVTMTGDTTLKASFSVPEISVAPSSESFGAAFVGASTSPQTITVTSSGTQALTIGTLSLSGNNATEFTKTGDTCSGHSWAPSTPCTVQVGFEPSSTGAKTANLLIPSNDPQTPVFSVSLNGIGVLPTLSVSRSGTESGVITSSPTGINCGGMNWVSYSYTCCHFTCHTCYSAYPTPGSCSSTFPSGTAVSLTAIPDIGYTFTGWSGACSGIGACALTMSADTNVIANFDKTPLSTCSANPVKVGDSYYPNIQSAYNNATDNSAIQLLAIDFTESFTADRDIFVSMDGGYLCGFAVNPDWTIVHGAPQILNGTVNMQNIQVNQ